MTKLKVAMEENLNMLINILLLMVLNPLLNILILMELEDLLLLVNTTKMM